jgi:hypothetical protein
MKHIKLFENWAEDIESPLYTDPDWTPFQSTFCTVYNMHSDVIKDALNDNYCDIGTYNKEDLDDFYPFAFMYFNEVPYWRKDGYDVLTISQIDCYYQLVSLENFPKVRHVFKLSHNEVESLEPLKNEIYKKEFALTKSFLQNLKGCPVSKKYDFSCNPLLSYYGVSSHLIDNYKYTICGEYCYKGNTKITLDNYNSVEFHAERFCDFSNACVDRHSDFWLRYEDEKHNPWEIVYYDYSEAGNTNFLFLPFYKNSERFREKAHQMIDDIDVKYFDDSIVW